MININDIKALEELIEELEEKDNNSYIQKLIQDMKLVLEKIENN